MRTKFYVRLAALIAVLIIATMAMCSAQEQSVIFREVLKVTNEVETDQLTIEGKTFTVYIVDSDYGYNHYVERVSKSGNVYKQYLGYITAYRYNSEKGTHDVFCNREGTEFWYLGLTKTGYLKKIPLTIEN